MSKNDVAVVGGGPAGMIAALEAARHGYDVALVAPTGTFTDSDDRTTAMMMPGVRMIEELGVEPRSTENATPMRTMRLIDGTRRLVRAPTVTFRADEIEEEAFGYNVVNRALNAALHETVEKAPNISVVNSMASSVSFAPEEAVIALANGETLETKLVVAADGVKSLVREAAGIGTRTWSYPQTAVVLTFEHSRDHNFTSTEFHRENGPFAQVPMAGRRSSLVWVEPPAEAERIASLDPETLAGMIERNMQSMLGKVSNVSKPQCWPLSGMIAHRFGAHRLMLVGQAAHVFPPIGAQGLNLSLRDVADLGKCLAYAGSDPGSAGVTARYNRLRRADVTTRTGTVDILNRSLLTGFLPVQFARAIGLGMLAAFPPLRKIAMREGMAPGGSFRHLLSGRLRGRDRAEADRSS